MTSSLAPGSFTVSSSHAFRSSDTVTIRSISGASSRRKRLRRAFSPSGSASSRPCSLWTMARTPANRAAGTASIAPQFREWTRSGSRRRNTRRSRNIARRIGSPAALPRVTCSTVRGRRCAKAPSGPIETTAWANSGSAATTLTRPFSRPPTSSVGTTWTIRSGRELISARPLSAWGVRARGETARPWPTSATTAPGTPATRSAPRVPAARPVLVEDPGHRLRVEDVVAPGEVVEQDLADVVLTRTAEPAVERHAKAHLPALHDRLGQQVGDGALERVLRLAVAELEARRKVGDELDEDVIEQRDARLQRHQHARPVDLREDVLRKVGLHVDVLERGQVIGLVTSGDERVEPRGAGVGADLGARLGRQQVVERHQPGDAHHPRIA